MRFLHRPVGEGILNSLHGIFVEGRPADKVIQWHLKNNRKWGSQDRRLFAEAVYDVVRWWRRLLFAADINAENPEAFAAALEIWCLLNEVELAKNIPRRFSNTARVLSRYRDTELKRAVRESVPDWLDNWAFEQLGAKWDEVLPVLNTLAPVYLRANRLKTTPKELVQYLESEKILADVVSEDGVKLRARANVFLTKAFRDGLFEVQDLNSQNIARELAPKPGERVIDACAGAGGKSLHLAALMHNKGKILSLDVVEKKLVQLRERATRAGATSMEVRLIENRKTIKRLEGTADRLLLDVPCSGLGVLRRNPDAKWKLKPEEIDRVSALQKEILSDYVSMLKPGGTLVYATCSIMPSENGSVVKEFMSRHETAFSLVDERTYWPETNGPDGFYSAKIIKS